MRDIKFRAWDNRNNKMEFNIHLFDGNNGLDMYLNTDRYIILQYTETKDRNGKEIYEGDIVKELKYSLDEIGIVRYDRGEYYIEAKDTDKDTWFNRQRLFNVYENIEIIGNIYENPDLLK